MLEDSHQVDARGVVFVVALTGVSVLLGLLMVLYLDEVWTYHRSSCENYWVGHVGSKQAAIEVCADGERVPTPLNLLRPGP